MINDYNVLNGVKYFVKDRPRNYLVFQSVFKYFQMFTDIDIIFVRKSKEMTKESFKTPVKSN